MFIGPLTFVNSFHCIALLSTLVWPGNLWSGLFICYQIDEYRFDTCSSTSNTSKQGLEFRKFWQLGLALALRQPTKHEKSLAPVWRNRRHATDYSQEHWDTTSDSRISSNHTYGFLSNGESNKNPIFLVYSVILCGNMKLKGHSWFGAKFPFRKVIDFSLGSSFSKYSVPWFGALN